MFKYPIELNPGDLVRHASYTEALEVTHVQRRPGQLVLIDADTAYGQHVEWIVSSTRQLEVD